jgi:hypothetical protein
MKLIALLSGLFFVAGNAMASVRTCQTAAEIKTHVETAAPEEFCFHKVVDPTVRLSSGKVIPGFNQLKADLEVAFLNAKENFDDTQVSCASLGAGWHGPASNWPGSDPHTNDNSNSAEAVGEYLRGTTNRFYFWSSSTDSEYSNIAFAVSLWFGTTGGLSKYSRLNVVCVRP